MGGGEAGDVIGPMLMTYMGRHVWDDTSVFYGR